MCVFVYHMFVYLFVCLFVCDKVSRQTGSWWWFGELQTRGKARQTGWFPADHVDLLQKKANVANTTPPPSSLGQQQPTGVAGGATGGVLGAQRSKSVSYFLTLYLQFCVINRRKTFQSISYISLTLCSPNYAASISPSPPTAANRHPGPARPGVPLTKPRPGSLHIHRPLRRRTHLPQGQRDHGTVKERGLVEGRAEWGRRPLPL